MRNHLLPTLLIAGALGAAALAVPGLAVGAVKTTSSIQSRATDNGQVIFSGRLKTVGSPGADRLPCRRERKVVLYRTVNSGFGDSTKKVATATSAVKPIGTWKITSRRSGKYFVKILATDRCPEGKSRTITYERDLGG